MYQVTATVRYLRREEGSPQESPIVTGAKAVYWMDEHGTSCTIILIARNDLAPGETTDCVIELPLGEMSLPRAPSAGDQVLLGRSLASPVLKGVVKSCTRRSP